MSIVPNIWPVILIPYNLPPWMCMKQTYFMLSLLIPGPKSPGNDIDVYKQLLVEELKELWMDELRHTMPLPKKNSKCMRQSYGLLVTFPHIPTCLDGALKGKRLVPLATRRPTPLD